MASPLSAALGNVRLSHHLCTELSSVPVNTMTVKSRLEILAWFYPGEPRGARWEYYIVIIMGECRVPGETEFFSGGEAGYFGTVRVVSDTSGALSLLVILVFNLIHCHWTLSLQGPPQNTETEITPC
ncbi:unnamed protein product [Pleuronectes platessa]|uniref:Uncharacterized protein n=1 Tax=Pleuronectes platessa TaxID=8262 RepID=A0A9N7VCY4_PLEPL|nr:unnamed protein product [Pleuronectes platessa]